MNAQQLQVYAAASLTDAFADLETAFETAHPGSDISLTFAGSQVLRLQIEHGAAADVFASANAHHMQALVAAGRIDRSDVFAHNELVVIVPSDNPAGIETIDDLVRAQRFVIGSQHVPIGVYAHKVIDQIGHQRGRDVQATIESHIVSEESNVRLIRAKVELGEADAALVYRTDAVSSAGVRTIAIPAAFNVRAQYPIGIVADSKKPALAKAWLAFLGSAEGQKILTKHGFSSP
ncbi:MAG: molybdate ABC transporter substrate-binding protein [Nannocystaceae bacterium]